MKRFIFQILLLVALSLGLATLQASSVLPLSFDEQFQSAKAIFRGTVVEVASYTDTNGLIYTRTAVRVEETFKGKCPSVIRLVHRGGEADGVGMRDDLSPRFNVGEDCVLYVSRREDGTLFADLGDVGVVRLQRGGAGAFGAGHENLLNKIRSKKNAAIPGEDVTDQSAGMPSGFTASPSGDSSGGSTNGLLTDIYGVPTRFPAPDRGETIPYLVDVTFLPTGITVSNALTAVSNAFSVWAAASSFKFSFAGTNNFGMAAANLNTNDGIFRIQLHDAYNYIASGNILGVGGSYYSTGLLAGASWGPGGNVAGMEFNRSQCGFVVLKHTNVVMQTLATFTEVLTHEVGHVIGLAHSSNVTTNDSVLTNSIMYYLAHADGRGAKLNSYDTNVIRAVHPFNTPPYSYDRVMDITTAPTAPTVAGINQIQLRGYDLQSANLTAATNNAYNNGGTFSLSGSNLFFTPVYTSGPRIDPATTSFYSILYTRFSDGTNASPYVTIRVVSFNPDSVTPSDGIPDAWMTQYFGNTDPSVGLKHQATNDNDGDGLNNLQEYIAGMVPTNSTSAQRITFISTNQLQWQAKAYELYEVQLVTNLFSTNWIRFGNPVLPVTSTGAISNVYSPTASSRFFRIQKVP